MMEIKFKFYLKDLGCEEIIVKTFDYSAIFSGTAKRYFNEQLPGCYIIGKSLFTGLKDKNGKGKELFHKDLIINYNRNDGKPHVIEWSTKLGAWDGVYGGLEYLIAQELHEIELVGNVFENKNLIK